MEPILEQRIQPTIRKARFRGLLLGLAVALMIIAVVTVVLLVLNRNQMLVVSTWAWWWAGGAGLAAIFGATLGWCWPVPQEHLVHSIESTFPELDSALRTAAEFQHEGDAAGLGFLQMDVLRRVVAHSYDHDWGRIIPGWQFFAFPIAGVIGLVAFLFAMIGLMVFPIEPPLDTTIPFSAAVVEPGEVVIVVEPGDCEIEKGTNIHVLARFPEKVPSDATLVYTMGDETIRVPMQKSLDDPLFGGRINVIDKPLSYHIEYGESSEDRSSEYRITLFEFPTLLQANATLEFPEYTQRETRKLQNFRRLTAVEGTQLTMEFFVNKDVESAVLVPVKEDESADTISLQRDSIDSKKFVAESTLINSQRYRLSLLDEEGRRNKLPPKFSLNVIQNRIPKIKVTPGRDGEASPLEEVQLGAEGSDDFGINAMGLTYVLAGKEPVEIDLVTTAIRKKQGRTVSGGRKTSHMLALESLGAQPDDLISYYFWVEDADREGNPRRVASDMYFIDVRRFEEIFRQGEAQPQDQQQQQQQQSQQQSSAAQQAQELAKLQKQIMAATWNLQRKAILRPVSVEGDAFDKDTATIAESQQQAVEQLQEMAQEIQEPAAQGLVESVQKSMEASTTKLLQAGETDAAGPLAEALASQQQAYQGLLKMRARENEVQQQQQSQSQSQSQSQNNRQQEQLNQLNLDQDRNRYEQEKTAQEQQEDQAEANADRDVLNRLKELARRQEDLNERIKELVTELEAADSEEDKEEIERRLKSLREQQEQMLRDAEELQETMESEENRERMAEEAEQLANTREGIRQTAESLENRELAQAAAEGTRVQRDLEELREEFKQRTAGQFNEQMRQMRNEIQDIEKKQRELSDALQQQDPDGTPDELTADDPDGPKSLREEATEPVDLEDELINQQERVEEIRKSMRQVIEESEAIEPLLADSLYETYRDSEANRPDQAIEATRRSLARGWLGDAQAQAERAQSGIKQLREGIEQAAENVLGDETEALRAAAESLDRLNEDLQDELEAETGQPSQNGENGNPNQNGDRESQQNAQGNSGREEGNSESSENDRQGERNGENESGEREPGERNPQGEQGDEQGRERSDDAEQSRDSQGARDSNGSRSQENQQQGNQTGQGNRPDGSPSENSDSQPSDDSQTESSSDNPEGQQQQGESSSENSGQGQGQGQGNRNASDSENANPSDAQQRPGDAESNREAMNELIEQLGGNSQNQTGQDNPDSRQSTGANRTSNAGNQRMRPISGDDFRKWYDELRDVEEMLDDPDLRAEASRVREQAREIRKEYKQRHSAEPNWELVKMKVAKPLQELQRKVADEILRRTSKDARVPINRKPIPVEYEDAVQQYYRRLGVGQ